MSSIDITDASAKLTMTVEDLYPSGFEITHFASDTAWSGEDAVVAEVRMGVDGHLAGGFTPTPRVMTFNLEANSPSYEQLNHVLEAQQLNMTIYKCNLTVSVPSIGKEYRLTNGVLTQGHQMPNGEKILGTTTWQLSFEKCVSSNI